MSEVPEDIKHEYLSLIRRIQSVSKSAGYSVVRISVLVDENGTPIAWTEPIQTKLEPRNAVSLLLTLGSLTHK